MKKLQTNKNRKYDITIIGRVAIDLNPQDYYNKLNDNKVFNRYLGGSAANIAIGVSRYDKKVNFISRVSSDQFGVYLTDYLRKENITIDNIQIDEKRKVGLTFTEMLSENESNILMYREDVADLAIDPCAIDDKSIKESKIVLISGTSLSSSTARESCLKVLNFAIKHNCVIVFDLDYRPYTWKSCEETKIYYQLVATQADVVIGSEEEFDFLKNSDSESYDDIVEHLLNKNTKICILKKGKLGSVLYSHQETIEVGIIPVKLLKGFGGGDAYAAAFLSSLLENYSLKECLENGVAAASIVVASLSSSEDLPDWSKLKKFKNNNTFSKPSKVIKKYPIK